MVTLMFFSSSFGATVTYTYDNLNRLTKAAYDNGTTEEFSYDAAGNRLTYKVTGPVEADTNSATNVTLTSATLNGTVNPNGLETTYYFEWGLADSYGNTTNSHSVGSGTSAVAVSANLSVLTPGTTYHYRLVATNSSGTGYGTDRTFKTQISGHGDYDGYGKTDISVWRRGRQLVNSQFGNRNSIRSAMGLGALNDGPFPAITTAMEKPISPSGGLGTACGISSVPPMEE